VRIDPAFPRRVMLVLLVAAVLAAYPLIRIGSGGVVLAVCVGALLSTVNVLAGFLTIEYSFEKSYTVFLKAVLGGMGMRMAVMLGFMLLLILVVRLETVPFIISLLGFYVVYLVLEILYLQKKVAVKNRR
jgi:hypothetical protein